MGYKQSLVKIMTQSCHGIFKSFRQGRGLLEHSAEIKEQDGVCGGLALIFLEQAKNGTVSNFIKGKDMDRDLFLLMKAEKLSQKGADLTCGVPGLALAAIQLNLIVSSGVIVGKTSLDCAKNTIISPSGMSYVALDEHAIAVYIKRDSISVFDPNFGFLRFKQQILYCEFLRRLFRSEIYKGNKSFHTIWLK